MITCHGKPVTLADLQRAYLRVCSRLHHPVQLRSKRRVRVWNDQGIRKSALELGCDYSHLSRVLAGKRHSARLIQRYRELVRAKGNF